MTAEPTVSIGLPVFNGQNYLTSSLDALLGQTFVDFEIIISDNASTDDTQQICLDYAAGDVRIRYIRQPENVGAIRNFNATFEGSRGKYFKWASHDDLCEPTLIEKCVRVLDDCPDVAWCHSDSDMIDARGESWKERLPADDEELEIAPDGTRRWKGLPRTDFDHELPHRRFAGVLLGTRWSVDSYGLMRADALKRTRMLVELYGAEKVLIGELSLIGKTFQIPELLFKQRIHVGASSYDDRAASQQRFASARNTKPFLSTRMAILQAHYNGVRQSKIPRQEKILCYIALARYVWQVNKWWRVLNRSIRRQGVGGGGKRIMEASRSSS